MNQQERAEFENSLLHAAGNVRMAKDILERSPMRNSRVGMKMLALLIGSMQLVIDVLKIVGANGEEDPRQGIAEERTG